MDAETGSVKFNRGCSGDLDLSLLSLSPDNSSETGSSPKTPEYTRRIDLDFGVGVGVGMTPTPPPSVEGPALFSSDACHAMRSNTFPVASTIGFDFRDDLQSAGSIWSSQNERSHGGGHLSHIWANRQATPPHIVPLADPLISQDHQPHTLPVGSSGPHGSLRYNLWSMSPDTDLAPPRHVRPSLMIDKPPRIRNLTGQSPFASGLALNAEAQGRQSFENAERVLVPVFSNDIYDHHLPPHIHPHHVQPLKDAILDRQEYQTVQDLGVDILRISPPRRNHYPVRQVTIPPARYPRSPFSLPHRHTIPVPGPSLLEDPLRQPIPSPPSPLPLVTFSSLHTGQIMNNNNNNNNNNNAGFTPMHAVNEHTRAPFRLSDGNSSQGQISNRFSLRYHGMHTEANASADHLSPDQNCALWLTNLPPDITPKQLLGAIRKVGRIWCSFINYPDYVSHHTAAAKVVFFTPKATQQFLSDSWTRGLFMGPNRVRVAHNRIKSESKEDELQTPKSRVLIITGRAEFVNEAYLTKYFKDRFIFQNDDVTELINAGGRAVLEWKFGSYRCQAQMGKMSLEKDRPYWLEKVEFGEDPCEVGDTYSSYGIAAERIQGRGL